MRRLEEGNLLGRYKILKRLGAGAMGEVFLAEDPQIGRRVALKTVRMEEGRASELEERKKRLLREARAAGKLLHPSIITLFDAGEDEGVLYLAFEFVEGRDLADRVAEGPQLTLGETLAIVRQAADGLDYAHRQGVVHRDIKPSNLMITADGRVKIADFGIARVADQTSDLTMTGSVVGSPHYMSPEQIRGEELDGRTDLFSLGVLLYEILCQRRPFEGETLTTLVYQILNQDPTPVVVRRPDLGPRLEQLVRRMLAKDRDQRFATAGDVAREIAACERDLSPAELSGAALREEAPSDATVRLEDAPTVARAVRPAAPPPPPPAAAPSPAPVAAAPPPPPSLAAAPAAAAAPKSRLALVAVLVVVVLGVLVVGGLAARRFVAGVRAKAAVADAERRAEESTAAARDSAPAVTEARPSPAMPAPQPLTQPEAPAPSPPVTASPAPATPAPGERIRTEPAAPAPVAPRPEATRPAPPPPAHETPRPLPAPAPVETRPASPPVEAEPAAPEPDSRAAMVERVPVDREMSTGMNLSFDLQPKEAAEHVIVKLDRTVIGLAGEWNAKKRDGRAYSVPDEGPHIITFLLDGTPLYRIRIDARPGGPNPTTVSLNLPQLGRRRR